MKEFKLTSKDGETIKTIKCKHRHEAVVRFSEIKKLRVRDLLEIFSVESV
jgi:hypothetical protein